MQKHELRPLPTANDFYREHGLNQLLWEQTRADALLDRLRLAVELLRAADFDCDLVHHKPSQYHLAFEPCPVEAELDRLLTSLPEDM